MNKSNSVSGLTAQRSFSDSGLSAAGGRSAFYAELGIGLGNLFRVADLYSVWSLSPEIHWAMRFRIHLGL